MSYHLHYDLTINYELERCKITNFDYFYRADIKPNISIKDSGFGDYCKEMLQDIAVLTCGVIYIRAIESIYNNRSKNKVRIYILAIL